MSIRVIDPTQLAEVCLQQPVPVIDVRTPIEFREIHCQFARNIPIDTLEPREIEEQFGDAETIYVICKSGARGQKACSKLIAAGFENVVNVEGGTEAWAAAGLPVVRGKKAMSLERQVRILAGLIILVGSVAALTINTYFAVIPAVMGTGLVFAGITNSCAIGMCLAKMPWNQVSDSNSCSTSQTSSASQKAA